MKKKPTNSFGRNEAMYKRNTNLLPVAINTGISSDARVPTNERRVSHCCEARIAYSRRLSGLLRRFYLNMSGT